MRIELPAGEDTILFDPAALADLLAEATFPADAFRRHSRRLDDAIRHGEALHVPRHLEAPVLWLDESLPKHTRPPDSGPAHARLRLPSGEIACASRQGGDGVPVKTLTRIEPGDYRVRFLVEENIPAPGPDPDRIPDPVDRLSPAERKAVRRHEDAVIKVGVVTAALAIAAVGWQVRSNVGLGLLLGAGVALLGCLFIWGVSRGPGVHPLLGHVRTARREHRRRIRELQAARTAWRVAGGRKLRDIVRLEPGR